MTLSATGSTRVLRSFDSENNGGIGEKNGGRTVRPQGTVQLRAKHAVRYAFGNHQHLSELDGDRCNLLLTICEASTSVLSELSGHWWQQRCTKTYLPCVL